MATTDRTGVASVPGLTQGTYTIVQTNAPGGYTSNPAAQTISIAPPTGNPPTYSQYQDVTVSSARSGRTDTTLRLKVIDINNQTKRVAGAVFHVKSSNGGTWTITSDKDGYAEVKNVTAGTYTITQISSPDGYSPMPASKVFEIPDPVPNRYPEYADVTVFNSSYDVASKGVLRINVQQENRPAIRIPNVTLKVTDDLGNTYIGVTDSNGHLAIKGLSVDREYSVATVEVPTRYDFPDTHIGGIRLNQVGQTNTATVHVPESQQVALRIENFETGDYDTKVNGTFDLISDDGTVERLTAVNGSINKTVSVLKRYIIRQVTSDSRHDISTEEFAFVVTREMEIRVPNPLKDRTSAKVSVNFTKEWVDKPTTVQSARFYLYKNGERYGNPVTIRSDATSKTHTFTDLPKYDDSHQVINWTVKEEAITDWYATYEETADNRWLIKNYEGALSGVCTTDPTPYAIVSATNTAYLVKNGQEVTRTILFPNTSSGASGQFGHAIAYSRDKGYLYGIDQSGEMAIMDPQGGNNGSLVKRVFLGQVVESVRRERQTFNGQSSYIHPNFRKVNTAETTTDGKYLVVKVLGDPNFYMYDNAQLEAAANGATVQPIKTIPAFHRADTSRWNSPNWWPISSGDVVFRENGDMIYSGSEIRFFNAALSAPQRDQLNYYFYYMKFNGPYLADGSPDYARGSWSAPQKAGYAAANTPQVNGTSITRGGLNIFTDNGNADFAIDGMVLIGSNLFVTSEVWTTKTNRILRIARVPLPDPSQPERRLDANFLDTVGGFGLNNPKGVNALNIDQLDDMTGAPRLICSPAVNIRGRKQWVGDSASDRPTSITVQLYADGVAQTGKTQTLTADNNWSYEFTGLQKYRTGSTTARIVYTVRETGVPSGYLVSYDQSATNSNAGQANSYDITNTLLKGGFSIKKTAEDGRTPLAGATFNVWSLTANGQKDKIVATGTSTNTGLVAFSGLSAGHYHLEEITAPDGYTATTTYTVTGTVNQTNKVVDFVVKNGNTTLNRDGQAYVVTNTQPTYKFKIVKIDGVTGQTITTTSRFAITDENGAVINRQAANLNNGEFTFSGFKPGTYYLKEETAPAGYIGLKEPVRFTLSASGDISFTDGEAIGQLATYDIDRQGGDTITFRVRNFKPKLRLLKVDASNETSVLPGAKFKLFQSNGTTQIGSEWTTDDTGVIVLEGVTPGTYYLQESQAPEGFQTNDKRYKIIVDNNYGVTTDNGDALLEIAATHGSPPTMALTFKNQPKPKVARFTLGKRIKGIENTGTHGITTPVTFTLSKIGDSSFTPIVQTKPFNQNFAFENLTPGLYKLEETQAPAGYVKVKETYLVSVDSDTTVRILKDTTATPAAKIATASLIKSDNISVIYSGSDADALDDNDNSFVWYNLSATTGVREGAYIGVDLGQVTKVTKIRFLQGKLDGADRMTDVVLEYSADGVNYTDLRDYTNTNEMTIDLTNQPIHARFVRMRSKISHRGWVAMRTMRVEGLSMETAREITPTQQGESLGAAGNLFLYGNIQNPSLNLQKVDYAGQIIPTTSRFKLYKVDDNLTTVSQNDISESNLIQEFVLNTGQATTAMNVTVLGKYALVETQAPAGYIGLTEPVLLNLVEAQQPHNATQNKAVTRFEVLTQTDKVLVDNSRAESSNTVAIKVTNQKRHELTIQKINGAGTNLAGAQLKLTAKTPIAEAPSLKDGAVANLTFGARYDQAAQSVTWTSSANRNPVFILAPGTYTLEELAAPDGYVKFASFDLTLKPDGSVVLLTGQEQSPETLKTETAEIVTANQAVTLKVINVKQDVHLKILKRDFKDLNQGLEAGFALFMEDGQTPVAGKEGVTLAADQHSLTWTGLAPGTYVLKETAAPDGYQNLPADLRLTISDTGTVTTNADLKDYVLTKPADATNTIELTIKNLKKGEFPPTGGSGTLLFYLLGFALMGLVGYRKLTTD